MTEESVEDPKMPRHQRYYALHREEKIAKDLARYHNRPDVIAKKEERERKKSDKEAEKEAKRIEKERIRQEKLELALATKQTKKITNLDGFLTETSPV
jgi:hypothetical protein